LCTAFATFRSESPERTFLSTPGPGSRKTKALAAGMHAQRAGAVRNRAGPVLRPEAGILARVPSPAKE